MFRIRTHVWVSAFGTAYVSVNCIFNILIKINRFHQSPLHRLGRQACSCSSSGSSTWHSRSRSREGTCRREEEEQQYKDPGPSEAAAKGKRAKTAFMNPPSPPLFFFHSTSPPLLLSYIPIQSISPFYFPRNFRMTSCLLRSGWKRNACW